MTRAEAREYCNGKSILDLVDVVHTVNTGSVEPSDVPDYHERRKKLKAVLKSWEPSTHDEWVEFEHLLRLLIEAVLREKPWWKKGATKESKTGNVNASVYPYVNGIDDTPDCNKE